MKNEKEYEEGQKRKNRLINKLICGPVTNDYISLYVTKRISTTYSVPLFNTVRLQVPRVWLEYASRSLYSFRLFFPGFKDTFANNITEHLCNSYFRVKFQNDRHLRFDKHGRKRNHEIAVGWFRDRPYVNTFKRFYCSYGENIIRSLTLVCNICMCMYKSFVLISATRWYVSDDILLMP